MKKIQFSIVLLLIIGAVACKKNENKSMVTNGNGITTDQAATISAGSLAVTSSGLATNFDDIASNAPISINQACGSSVTDSTTKSGTVNGVTYNYSLKYTHMLNCNSQKENDNLVYDLAYHGHSDGAAMSTLDTGTSTFTVAGFTPAATYYQVNGEYKRTGTFKLKTGEAVSGSSIIDIVVTNLQISHSTKAILNGTGTITLTVTVPKGTSKFTAPLTFKGDGTASVTLNGNAYSINLYTGVITNG